MYRYIINRLIMLIPVLLGVVFIVFFIMDLAPGDPVYQVAGEQATPAELQELRVKLGLDGNIFTRYARYIKNMLHIICR